ncbi:hypothetical protein HZY97_16160 [Sphingomonas sp. R-74633]|nr:hypothetical protein [Sphingomonas sp. R-74633]NYT42307.1 hypothetical protein [Sphingomonas sp. R-74633]
MIDFSNGKPVCERVYTPAAALDLADQLVRAVTSPRCAQVTPLKPPR